MSHAVVEALKGRAKEHSQPGKRKDRYKIGLVIEGGGMRGVVGGGMVTALEHLGLRNSFDVVYGGSAGSITGAYFLAEQAAYGTTIYYQNINNHKFIYTWPNPILRMLCNKQIMYMKYLMYTVMTKEKYLNWQRVIKSDIPLKVAMSSIEDGKLIMADSFSSRDELFEALRAGATIPLAGGKPVSIGGKMFMDASVYAAIPVYEAIKDGCTHILVLRTRPRGVLRNVPQIMQRFIYMKMKSLGERFAQAYVASQAEYNHSIKFMDSAENIQTSAPFICSAVLPRGMTPVSQLETRAPVLIDAARQGVLACLGLFGRDSCQVVEVLKPSGEIFQQGK